MRARRRIFVALLLAAIAVLINVAVARVAVAAPGGGGGSCDPTQQTCSVGAGGGGRHGGGSGGAGGGVDPCADYPRAVVGEGPPTISQACADDLHGQACQAIINDTEAGLGRPPAQWTLLEVQTTNVELAGQGCPALVTPVMLANRAYKSIHFPSPSGDRSPSENQRYRGYPFTYTGLWTWYWTGQGTWRTLTATASAGGVSATVTARPVSLIYDPGDGGSAAQCSGPGRPWSSADANTAPSDGGCAYQYHQVTSTPITSTQSIIWKITWTGTGGAAGQFPQLTTSTSGRLNVMQIQTVVTR